MDNDEPVSFKGASLVVAGKDAILIGPRRGASKGAMPNDASDMVVAGAFLKLWVIAPSVVFPKSSLRLLL